LAHFKLEHGPSGTGGVRASSGGTVAVRRYYWNRNSSILEL